MDCNGHCLGLMQVGLQSVRCCSLSVDDAYVAVFPPAVKRES